MRAELVLKCEGRTEKSIVFCSGTENAILDLEGIRATEHYSELLDYLNNIGLFSKPCFDNNKTSNVLYKIYSWEYWIEKEYEVICRWLFLHRACGVILLVRPKGD